MSNGKYAPDEDDARARYVATRDNGMAATEAEAKWAQIITRIKREAARAGYRQGYNDRAREQDYNLAYPEQE